MCCKRMISFAESDPVGWPPRPPAVILCNMQQSSQALIPIAPGPDPVIEAYKKDVDRTLLRENLRLTTEQRIVKMIAALALVEELRRSKQKVDES